jgi:hypothetical protein
MRLVPARKAERTIDRVHERLEEIALLEEKVALQRPSQNKI